jgi:drug/metabolite transporter (DMT)-like permease
MLGTEPVVRWLLLSRALFGSTGMLAYFFTLSKMRLADATVVVFTNPIFTAVGARLLLKEAWTPFDSGAAVLCFIGVVFVAQPSFLFPNTGSGDTSPSASSASLRLVCVIVGVVGAILSSLSYLSIRAIGKRSDPNVVVFWFAVGGIVISTVPALAMGQTFVPKSWKDAGLFLLMGIAAYVGQALMTRGLALEKAAPAVMMRCVHRCVDDAHPPS